MLSLLLKTKRSFWVLLFLSIRFSFPSRCVKLCSKIQQNIQIFAATNTEAQINFMLQNHRLVSNTTMNSLQSPSAPQLARKRTQMNMNGKLWFLYMKAQFVWKLNLYKSGLTIHTKYMIFYAYDSEFSSRSWKNKKYPKPVQSFLLLDTGGVQGKRDALVTSDSLPAKHRTSIFSQRNNINLLVRLQSQLTKIYLLQM